MNEDTGSVALQFSSTIIGVLLTGFLFAAFAVFLPRVSKIFFAANERALSRLAEHKTLAICVLFFAVVGIRLLLLPFLPVPVPGIHDEFSYLLMADTFAHGRLANPPHPMWMSFETFHVNWFPTYSSMYPPAQGFVLALGELLGHPWIGVLLSDAAMCAVILWMLQAWMPARWAFLGAALVALKFGFSSYWMNSYWGGAVAATGGALLLGALPRILRSGKAPAKISQSTTKHALLLGLGIAILANSRPFEGLLLCIPAAAYFLWWLARKRPEQTHPQVRKTLLPLAAVLFVTAAFMGYYNWRLTGNPLLLPHTLNVRTYHTAPMFIWQHAKPPRQYNNAQFEDFYNDFEREEYRTTFSDFRSVSWVKITRYTTTYFWMGLLLIVPWIPFAFRERRIRLLVVSFLFCVPGLFAVVWSNSHYAAPLTCVFFALIVQAIRHLRTCRIAGRPVGTALSWATVALLVFDVGGGVAHRSCDPIWWTCQGDVSRAAIQKTLESKPGKHLIIVRYGDDHNIHDEWVYNGAEIDGAKVLWARELTAEQNQKLFEYFKDRQVWLVTPDTDNTYLEPYSPPDDFPGRHEEAGAQLPASEVHKMHAKLFDDRTGQGSLLDRATREGDLRITILPEVGLLSANPTPSPELAFAESITCGADAVIIGVQQSSQSFPTENQEWVFTDNAVTVHEILKDNASHPLAIGSTIIIARSGGSIEIPDGHHIVVTDPGYPPLYAGGTYVLALKYVPSTGQYWQFDHRGGFRIEEKKALSLISRDKHTQEPRYDYEAEALSALVRHYAAQCAMEKKP